MSKGSTRRPTNEHVFGNNFDSIFRKPEEIITCAEILRQTYDLLGLSKTGNASGSNPDNVGSSPTAPAIYIDDATGDEVSEHWWPDVR